MKLHLNSQDGSRTGCVHLALGLVLLALVSGCGEKQSPQIPLVEGKPFPSLTLNKLNGGTASTQAFKGKMLVLNVWATWCPPCRAEIPEFIRFQKQYAKQGVQFVGIAIDQKSKVQAYAKEVGMNYPILLGDLAGIELAKRIGNSEGGLPYSVIIDRKGQVITTQIGTLTYDKLEATVKPLL